MVWVKIKYLLLIWTWCIYYNSLQLQVKYLDSSKSSRTSKKSSSFHTKHFWPLWPGTSCRSTTRGCLHLEHIFRSRWQLMKQPTGLLLEDSLDRWHNLSVYLSNKGWEKTTVFSFHQSVSLSLLCIRFPQLFLLPFGLLPVCGALYSVTLSYHSGLRSNRITEECPSVQWLAQWASAWEHFPFIDSQRTFILKEGGGWGLLPDKLSHIIPRVFAALIGTVEP